MLNHDNTIPDVERIVHSLCTTHCQNSIYIYHSSRPITQAEPDTNIALNLTHLQISPIIYQHNRTNYTG